MEEKLHIYAELGELSGFEDVHLEPHLLIKLDPGEPPQAASLLAAALKEGELLLEGFGLTNSENVLLSIYSVPHTTALVLRLQENKTSLYPRPRNLSSTNSKIFKNMSDCVKHYEEK